MNRNSDMLRLTGVVTLLLLLAGCGGEPSVASKSAEAYREAQEKGMPISGGHEHGGHSATDTTATGVDHSAHGATSDDAHAGMNHGSTGVVGATDHSGHGAAMSAADHAAMGHGSSTAHTATGRTADAHAGHTMTGRTADAHAGHTTTGRAADAHAGHTTTGRTTDAHAGHAMAGRTADAHAGHTTAGRTADAHAGHTPAAAAVDHAAMGHGTAAAHPAPAPQPHAHAQHSQPAAPSSAVDHSAHAATQPLTPDPHAGHAAPPLPSQQPEAPRTSAAIAGLEPGSTLGADRFDKPVPISVAEAVKAAAGGGHEGHDTKWITPGEDQANPPTPMPPVRTRANTEPTAPVTDHSQHGASTPPQAAPDASVVYVCPMHPDVTSDKPGTCPKCGMALVRKK